MLELFLAELKRIWTEFIRYPVEAISGVIITTSLFYGLFLSARYIAGPTLQFGDRLDGIIVGYVLWTLVIFIVFGIAISLQIEAQTGTLEQLFLSPFGAWRVFLTRAIANLILNLVLMLSILFLTILLTGRHLSFPPSLLLPFITVILGAYGLAFIMGALALLFKRIQQLLGLFQFVLLFLIITPTETWTGSLRILRLLLPMTLGAGELRDLMARNQSLDWSTFALALLNGVVYLVCGLVIFRACERKAKLQGLLSGY